MSALVHEPDPAVGAWIGPRLRPFGDGVGSVVPQGYEAYARLLHPVPSPPSPQSRPEQPHPRGGPTWLRWSDVAARTGRTVHALAQFWAVAGREGWRADGGAWPWTEPEEGNLEPAALATLLDVLARHTPGAMDAEVVVALWEGFGWVHGGGAVTVVSWETGDDGSCVVDRHHPGPAFPPEVLDGPRLRLPARDHILLRGRLRDVPTLGHQVTETWFDQQSPTLLWPLDRSWCVATEIDLDSTLVGGSREVVDAILSTPALEAYEVRPEDPTGIDSDALNRGAADA